MTSVIASEPARRRATVTTALIAALVLSTLPAPARADVTASDKAAAEALFEHGKSLMKERRFGDACAKFQESQRIDPGIGTMLYLADCFEKNGQTASAWATFLEAAAAARAATQSDREKKARDRAAALEGKLNKLSITVAPNGDVAGIEVKRDGVPVTKALWGTPVPVDPGEHVIDATAPGKKPWTTKIKLDPANLAPVAVVVPQLADAPPPEPPKVDPPKVEPAKVDPPKVDPPKEVGPRADPPKPPPIQPGPIVTTRDSVTSPGRVAGGLALGVGIAGLAAGGILGALALQNNAAAKDNCWENNVCNSEGTNARNAALGMANGSTIAVIAGGVATAAGIVVLLATNPGSEKAVVSLRPLVSTKSGGLSVGGSF